MDTGFSDGASRQQVPKNEHSEILKQRLHGLWQRQKSYGFTSAKTISHNYAHIQGEGMQTPILMARQSKILDPWFETYVFIGIKFKFIV